MKRILSVALALIMVMGCLSSVSVCASAATAPQESNTFKFALLTFLEGDDGKSAYVDLSDPDNMLIFGVKAGSCLASVLTMPENIVSYSIDGTTDEYATIRNGSVLTVTDDKENTYSFTFVIYGDIDCDGALDVLDSAMIETIASGSQSVEQVIAKISNPVSPICVEMSADINQDGQFTTDDLQQSVNISVDTESFDQTRIEADEANTVNPDVDTQVFTGETLEPVSELNFNNLALSLGDDYEVTYSQNTEKGIATVTITGKGLYTGTVVKNFKITDVLGKAVSDVDKVLTNSGLGDVFSATYDDETKVIDLDVNSDALLAGNFTVDSTALNGLLTRIGSYFDTTLANVTDITVDGNQLYNGESVDNTAVKNTIFTLARGFFVNIAGMNDDGIIKTLSGTFTESGNEIAFTANIKASGTPESISTLKNFATKFANHLSFEVVGGNAVVTVKMPQGFMNTLVSAIGDGDVAETKRQFDTLTVDTAFAILEDVTAEEFAPSAANFTDVLNAIASLDGFINKILTKITTAQITDTKGNTYAALSDNGFEVVSENTNVFGALAGAVGNALSSEVRATKVGDYYLENGVYKVAFDIGVDVSNLGIMSSGLITERVIVQLDIFDITDTMEPAAKSGGSTLNVAKLPVMNAGAEDEVFKASIGSEESVYASGNETVTLHDCPLSFIIDANGKIANLDYNKNILSGIKLGSSDVSEYITLPVDSAYTLSVNYSFSNGAHKVLSTGSVINVMSGADVFKAYTVSVPGDINGDGIIDVLDVFSIEREVNSSEFSILDESQKAAVAAVTGDETISVDDFQQTVNAAISEEEIEAPKKIPLTGSAVSAVSDVIYNGYRQEPTVIVSNGGNTLTKGSAYSVEYTNNLNAGTATVTVTGIGDYVGKVVKTFSIDKATITSDMLSYNSEIIACSGSKKAAAISFNDISLGDVLKVKYNGSETIPTLTGIYVITAAVSGSQNYNDASFTLGTLTVAPKSVSGEYNITVDNNNRTITVNIIKPYAADTNIITALNSYINSAYTLKNSSGTAISSVTASMLSSRSYNVYTGQTGSNIVITSTNNLLGGLLPDDETLWSNYLSAKSHNFAVSYGDKTEAFTLKIMQNKTNIEIAKHKMLATVAANGRGQRITNGIGSDVVAYAKTMSSGYPEIRVAANSTSASCKDALSGSGLKTMLVGYCDAISFQSSSTTSFSNQEVTLLYNTSSDNMRYVKYGSSDAATLLPVVNATLKGLNIKFSTLGLIFSTISSFIGKTGYCNYRCSEASTGLRYNNVYYIEFQKFDNVADAHHTLTINTATNGKISSNIAAAQLVAMAQGEQVTLTVTPNSGFSVKEVLVKDASGNTVEVTLENGYYYFTMPASDVTVNATFA